MQTVDVNQSLFPYIPVLADEIMKKVAISNNIKFMHGLRNTDLYSSSM